MEAQALFWDGKGPLSVPSPPGAASSVPPARQGFDPRAAEDNELVRRVREGDEVAFEELVRRYQSKVFSIGWTILRDCHYAEEVAQQVFTKVFFSIRNFTARSSFYTWLYRITVNECFDFLRRNRARKLMEEPEPRAADGERPRPVEPAAGRAATVEESLQRRDLAIKLLQKLSPDERSLLLLKEVEGHSVKELAALTGLNENTIKVKLLRARLKAARAAQRLRCGAGRQPSPVRPLVFASHTSN